MNENAILIQRPTDPWCKETTTTATATATTKKVNQKRRGWLRFDDVETRGAVSIVAGGQSS